MSDREEIQVVLEIAKMEVGRLIGIRPARRLLIGPRRVASGKGRVAAALVSRLLLSRAGFCTCTRLEGAGRVLSGRKGRVAKAREAFVDFGPSRMIPDDAVGDASDHEMEGNETESGQTSDDSCETWISRNGQHCFGTVTEVKFSPDRDLPQDLVLARTVVRQADLLDSIQMTVEAVPSLYHLSSASASEELELLELDAVA